MKYLKLKLMSWLLSDHDARKLLIETVLCHPQFIDEMAYNMLDAAEDAIDEHERDKNHDPDEILGTPEFERAVQEAVPSIDADEIVAIVKRAINIGELNVVLRS